MWSKYGIGNMVGVFGFKGLIIYFVGSVFFWDG